VEDVDFIRGIVHPRVQYPAEPLKTKIPGRPSRSHCHWPLSCPPRSPLTADT
jgi:hypothetical protein